MTDNEIKAEFERLHARLDAYRAIFTVLATAIAEIDLNAGVSIKRGLRGFEAALRATNERDAVLQELRAVREILEHLGKPEGSEEDE